jgi:hypothetical protein
VKDRMLTLALAAGALFAFYSLFVPRSGPKELMTRPTSIERGPNGYLGLKRWLDGRGVKTASFRDRYGKLAEFSAPAAKTGNLLLSTAPHFYPMRDAEARPLLEWIESGNTLLLVVGLSDTPDWSMNSGQDPSLFANLELMTGLTFRMVRNSSGEVVPAADEAQNEDESEREYEDESDADDGAADTAEPEQSEAAPAPTGGRIDPSDIEPPAVPDEQTAPHDSPAEAMRKARAALQEFERLPEPQRFELVPIVPHPLLANVDSVETQSEYLTGKFTAMSADLVLELAREKDSDVPVLWLLPYGDGQIIVSAYGNVFTNKVLGKADNGQLFANIVSTSLQGDGAVIFDDAHQGLVAFYDPEAFFGDARLHRSLWWLLALWLVFVLGAQRLRAGVSRWSPLDVTTFVRATGGFMARVLKPASAAQRLIRNFLDDVRRRTGLTSEDGPVWEWLRAHRNVDDADIERLMHMQDRAAGGHRVDLPRLQTLLSQLRASIK